MPQKLWSLAVSAGHLSTWIFLLGLETCMRPLPVSLCARTGSILGFLSFYLFRPYRDLAISNLSIAFAGELDERQIRRLAKRHFTRLGSNALACIKTMTMSEKAIQRCISIEGWENFETASAGNRGVVYLLSHLGNWELLSGLTFLEQGRSSGTLYQSIANSWIDRHVLKRRSRFGLQFFDRSEGFQPVIKIAREGGVVGVLADQHAGDTGLLCPFFGKLASTTTLPALIKRKTNSALLPVTVRTEGPGKWRIIAGKPIGEENNPDGTRPSIKQITQEANRSLEENIRLAPEDWFWVHDRWKIQTFFLHARQKRGISLPKHFSMEQLKPFRILLRSPNWLGDACMSVPAVKAIKHGRSDASITVFCEAKLKDFWETVPEVDHVLTKPGKGNPFKVGKLIRQAGKFDVGILFTNSLRSALEFKFGKILHIVGYAGHHRSRYLHNIIEPPQGRRPPEHQVRRYLRIALRVGGDIKAKNLLPEIRAAVPQAEGQIRVGICPGAEYGGAKRWPAEKFAEVANEIHRRGIEVEWTLFGVAAEVKLGDDIASRLNGQCTNLIGKTTLAEAIAEIQKCQVMLTNDTGTMHLAAHLGIPNVAIFGPTEPSQTHPIGSGHTVVRHHVECSPCFLRECPLDWRCMKEITSQEVAWAVLHKLRAGKESQAT